MTEVKTAGARNTCRDYPPLSKTLYAQLIARLGRLHARQRLGMELDYESKVIGPGVSFVHLENWYSIHSVIRNALRITGLYGRGHRNTLDIRVRHHELAVRGVPPAFEGYRMLHISDVHADMNPAATEVLCERVRDLEYDLCVMTGDYRARTYGDIQNALDGMRNLRARLKGEVYGVLGNHDTVRMVPELESMGYRMLLNETVAIEREGGRLHLAGVDDGHYFHVDNIEKAAEHLPEDEFSILLSHTPELYRQAAHADFNIMLCGHTHGGQICLPGGIPITWDARCPRAMAAGLWRYHTMIGYTSVGAGTSIVSARLNCPPEITVHRLWGA